jgi:hypothetical protein
MSIINLRKMSEESGIFFSIIYYGQAATWALDPVLSLHFIPFKSNCNPSRKFLLTMKMELILIAVKITGYL